MSDLVKRYRELQDHIGGCSDGYCVIKKPSGMHTNGGCHCLMDLKLHEASRVGHLLRYAQEMADRIEALGAENKRLREVEAKLEKAVKAGMHIAVTVPIEDVQAAFDAALAELKGGE